MQKVLDTYNTIIYAYKLYLPKSVSTTLLLTRLDESLLILKQLVIPLETFIYRPFWLNCQYIYALGKAMICAAYIQHFVIFDCNRWWNGELNIINAWTTWMNTINDILKYKDTVEVITKDDKNTWVRVMVFDSTFNNMSAISWWSVVLVEETGMQVTATHSGARIHLAMNGIRDCKS